MPSAAGQGVSANPPIAARAARKSEGSILDTLLIVAISAAFLFALYGIITVPLSLPWQAGTGAIAVAFAIIFRRRGGRRLSLMMMALSVSVSTRYLYWRLTSTLPIGEEFNAFDLVFATGLIIAELYAFAILVLGYFQVLWPLNRTPEPLPDDIALWPMVDVFIPTYNEPLSVVRPTVLAAMELDWPADKFNVYVLDDGRREEFREFCAELGVTHLTRPDNKHAKAGNINHALTQTHGTYVAIFDCDHIPTRSFLQMTLGTMLNNPKMALVQTPHHFFSPDPFERNLRIFRSVPNEGELFYGLLQDGNDYWNAAFFCGSCAVIRRSAMEEIGGIATETVTEDAHTALRLHSLGWDSAYINIPQAAGLATESLSAHVGQRIRWARGMAQIFRIDNPFLMPGLTIGQRLCYANAMAHFFYGIPRLIFLTSPLAFLMLNAEIIRAQGLLILAYAAPHVMMAITTNSRLQGKYRHSFWAEVYETVLAIFITGPTTLAVINPKLGKFNVTAKGGIVNQDYFDGNIAKPYYLLYLLNIVGVAIGILRLIFGDSHRADTVALNLGWTLYNLLIIGAALCVASETRQTRQAVRVRTTVPVRIRRGHSEIAYEAQTKDLSYSGLALESPEELEVKVGDTVEVALMPSHQEVWISATVRRAGSRTTSLEFGKLTLDQERQVVNTLFGRADAWLQWRDAQSDDRPLHAFASVVKFSFMGSVKFFRWTGSQLRAAVTRSSTGAAATSVLLALGLMMFANAGHAAATASVASASFSDQAFNETGRKLGLSDLGQRYPIRLETVLGQASIPVAIRHDQVVTKAVLHLQYAHSPSLIPNLSHLNVLVNDELATTIPLVAATASGGSVDVELNPSLFGEFNQLRLEAVQHYTNSPNECEDPTHTSLWSIVSNKSTLELTIASLAGAPSLSALPRPFFDSADTRPLKLPISFMSTPGRGALSAGAIVASWFGAQADYRGAEFPVRFGTLPDGLGIVLRVGNTLDDKLGPAPQGPQIRVIVHPDHPQARLLVIEAPDEAGLLLAAQGLALGAYAADGDSAQIHTVTLPALAERDAAPHWLNPDHPVQLKDVTANVTSVQGLTPGPMNFDFRLPPDIFFLDSTGAILDLNYRYSPVTAAGSSLSALLNEGFLGGVMLSKAGKAALNNTEEIADQARFYLPASRLSAQNRLTLQFQFRRDVSKPCEDFNNRALGGSVDPDSTIHFRGFQHYALWPDLTRFRDGGLPFTTYPDLARSVFLVPDVPDEDDVTALMTVAGHLGHITGMAGLRLTVDAASTSATYPDRDQFLIGRSGQLPQLAEWRDRLPLSFDANVAQLRGYGAISRWQADLEGRDLEGAIQYSGRVLVEAGRKIGALMGTSSPYSSEHAAVILTAGDQGSLAGVAAALVDPARNQFMQGDLALVHGTDVSGYQLNSQYGLGWLPWNYSIKRWMSRHPYLVAPLSFAFAIVAALVAFPLLRRRARRRLKSGSK